MTEHKVEKTKRRGGCLKWLLIIIIVLIAFVACVAAIGGGDSQDSGEEPTNVDASNEETEAAESKEKEDTTEKESEDVTPEDTMYGVGEPMNHEGTVVTVNSVEKRTPQSYDAVQDGYEFVVVNLTFDNESDEEISYNVMNFELQDGNGNITSAFGGGSLDDVGNTLSAGQLASGGTVSGNLIFEVPEGDEDLTLRYNASFWSDTTIKFNLY